MRWAGALLLLFALTVPMSAFGQGATGGSGGEATQTEDGSESTEIAGSGLVFVADERIAIEALDVALSRASVRATYLLRNTSTETLARVVTWPLPELDGASIGDDTVLLAQPDATNFVGGTIAVDGRDVAIGFEQRAVAFGRDVTALLEAAGLSLNPKGRRVEERLADLPPDRLADLEERGIIRRDDDHFVANWTARTIGFWRQVFEPGKVVTITLSFVPIAATGPWRAESLDGLRDSYCIGKATEDAIAARLAAATKGVVQHRLTFVPGAAGGKSVPSFRLAIEKSQVETIAATCRDGMKIVGPTLLEWTGRDVNIADEIRALFLD
ncbi:MAG: DUF4424 family protein [Proteobacteria bacterium]|nr:DUF4424 family protein [Pseudomonadota bacterium]